MRKPTIAVGVVVLTSAFVTVASPALAEPASGGATQPTVPAQFLSQKIDWKPGFKDGQVPDSLKGKPGADRYEVGTLTVPQDWHHPDNGKTITVAASRIRNDNGAPRGSLVINPGG